MTLMSLSWEAKMMSKIYKCSVKRELYRSLRFDIVLPLNPEELEGKNV